MYKAKYPLVLSLLSILVTACGGGADTGASTASPTPADPLDTTQPAVTITGPVNNASYSTSSATLSLSGSASDNVGVTQVTWSNSRGGSGTANGTTSWNTGNITLQSGSNVITVTARDAAGNPPATDTLTVTYSTTTPGDTTAPSVTISAPTSNPTYTTSSNTLNLSGSASDNVGVTRVTWSNDRGGSGTAVMNGTTSWSANSITLQSGNNVISVRAYDAANNASTIKTLTAIYSVVDTIPPTISSTNPVNGATSASTGGAITVTFSEAMSAASINASTFTVNGVSGSIRVNGATATFTPSSALANTTRYTATVVGGTNGVKDATGNALASNYSWSFTTSAPLACDSPTVLCVDDTAGATQEYPTIQDAVNVVLPGDTVLVYDGTYRGFTISRSGNSSSRIVIKAAGSSAVINQTNAGGAGEGITINNASYVTIEGFTVTGMSGYGIGSHNGTGDNPIRGVIVRNNTVQNSGLTNIYLSHAADSLIEGNTASGGTNHGIYLANGGSDNTTIRGNRCFNNSRNGIHLNGDARYGGDGLHKGIILENNILYDNVANGFDLDGVQDSIIRNNLTYGNGRHGLRVFQIDAAAGAKNLIIVNNTFHTPSNGSWALKLTEDQGGHVIFNNILMTDNTNSNVGSISVGSANFTSNNNALVGRFSYDSESSIINLANWQAAGFDTNSFTTTPSSLFVNAAADNFQLKAGAPAIDAGVASLNGTAAPSTDILGAARLKGAAIDLGVYESY